MKKLLTTLCAILMAAVLFAEDITTETLRFVPGVWASDGAKIAAWVWGNNVEAGWTSFFTDEGDTLSTTINAQADSLIFVRFNSSVTEPTWEGEENYIWNSTDNKAIDHQSLVYAITGWNSSEWVTTGSGSTDPETGAQTTYYLIGSDPAIGAWEGASSVAMIGDSAVVSLQVGDCEFKVVPNDWDWSYALGFGQVNTDCSSGDVSAGGNDNVKVSLTTAGEIKVKVVDGKLCVTGDFETGSTDPEPSEQPTAYVVGNTEELGAWTPANGVKIFGDSVTINLAAGSYSFKVTSQADWSGQIYGFSDLTSFRSGLTTDTDNNILFTLTESGAVTIKYGNGVFDVILPASAVADHYYLIGNTEQLGAWNPSSALMMADNTITLNLPAGSYAIKVLTEEKSWATALDFSSLNKSCSSVGLGSDSDGNTRFTLVESSEVTVSVADAKLCVSGSFAIPESGSVSNYAVLVNHDRYIYALYQGYTAPTAQYLAHVQLSNGDTVRIINRANKNSTITVDMEEAGEYSKFKIDHDGWGYAEDYFICLADGCYDFYYKFDFAKASYGKESLYVGVGTDCEQGETFDNVYPATAYVRLYVSSGYGNATINGSGSSSGASGSYVLGSIIDIESQSGSSYVFTNWSDGSYENPRRMTVTEDIYFEVKSQHTSVFPLGIWVNKNRFIRSNKNEFIESGSQDIVHAQLEANDTICVLNITTSDILLPELEPYGEYANFTLTENSDGYVCKVAGCYDFYLKKDETDRLQTIYVGEGSTCYSGIHYLLKAYYLIGDNELLGAWNPNSALPMENDSITVNLPAGSYAIKVLTEEKTWETELDCNKLNQSCSSTGLTSDADYNIRFTLEEAGDMTVIVDYGQLCVTGAFKPYETGNFSNYGVLINQERLVKSVYAGLSDTHMQQYLAHIQLNAGELLQIINRADKNNVLKPSLESTGEYNNFAYDTENNGYICSTTGCYDLYYKAPSSTSSDGLFYIGSGSEDCSSGDAYDGSIIPARYVYTYISSTSAGAGSVSIDGYGTSSYKSGNYITGSTVTLEASPSTGFQFLQWSDGELHNPRQLIVSKDSTISAKIESTSKYPVGILLNRKKFIRSTFNDGTQLIVRANIQEGDTVELYYTNDNIFWMSELEHGGLYENFTGGVEEGHIICNASGCYDIYFKLEEGITQSIYIGEGTVCSDGEDWTEPEPQQYYLIGSVSELGAWSLERALLMDGDSIALDLPANAYEFKILPEKTSWDNALGYSNFNAQCSSEGLEEGADNNIKFTLSEAGNVIVRLVDGQICVTGMFGGEVPITGYSVVGDENLFGIAWNAEDTRTEMRQQEGNVWTYTLDSVLLNENVSYQYKIIANHNWAVAQYPSSTDGDNYELVLNKAGYYSVLFTFTEGVGCTPQATLMDNMPCIEGVGTWSADESNVHWVLSCDNVITFSGYGAIKDENFERLPWYSKRDLIYHAVIEEGITHVGNDMFYDYYSLQSVDIPQSVTSLGDWSFRYSGLTHVTIPSGVTDIGKYTFQGCRSLSSITSKAVTPPTLGTGPFELVDKSIPLFVPQASISAYQSASGWSEFTNIQSIEGRTYYLVGSGDALGSWTMENALPMDGDSLLLHLPANTYQFKIYPQQSWNNELTYSDFNATCSSPGVIKGDNNNLMFAMAEEGDVTIRLVDDKICVNGAIKENVITGFSVVGDSTLVGVQWDPTYLQTEMTQQEGGTWTYQVDSVYLLTGGITYQYKIVANHSWDVKQYPSYEENDNYMLTVPRAGTYSVLFTFTPEEGCTATATIIQASPVSLYSVIGSTNLFGTYWDATDTQTDMSLQSDGSWTYMIDSIYLDMDSTYYYKFTADHSLYYEQYPSVAENDNYTITVPRSGTYSVTFTLIPGEGGTAVTTRIIDDGNQGGDTALQLWAIWLDSITAYKYPESFMGDFTPSLPDNNFYIWNDTYTLRETSGLGYYNTNNDVMSLTVGNVGWSGAGMNLNVTSSIRAATSLMNMIVAQPENYFFHLAVRSTTAGNHQFYLFGSDATSFGIGDYGSEIIDFGEGITGPAIGDFARNGEWQEFWIPMTLFADKIANLPSPTESFNIFCILSGGTQDVQIDLDAMYFCNTAMKEEFIRFKQGSDYLQANPKTFWPVLLDGSFCYYNSSSCMGYMTEDESNTNLYIWGDSYTIDVAHEQGFYENSSSYVTMTITDKGWAGAGWNTVTTASLGVITQLMDSIIARPDNYYLHLALKSTTAGNHQFYFLGSDATSFGIGNYDSEIVDFGDGITGPAIGNFPRDGQWYDFWIPMTLFADKIANMPKPTDNINYFCILSKGAEGANISMDAIYFCSASMKEDFIKLAPQVKTNYYIVGAIPPFQSLENAMYMDGDSIVLDLPANAYEFKVLPQNTSWDCELGFSAIDASCSSEGLETEGTNNIVFSMVNGGELKVKVVDSKLCVTGPIGGQVPITGYSVVGDIKLTHSDWDITNTSTDMVQQGDYWSCTIDSVYLETDSTYYYKIYANHTWLVKQYPGYQNSYSLTTQETGFYSVTFTLIPNEGGTAVATRINNDPCPIASGTCGANGDNLTWVLGCDSVLTISGEGEMPSSYSANATPWYQYGQAIKHINIEEGVTKLALNAFYNAGTSANYPNVRTLSIPSTLGAPIENSYFYGCPFKTVTINSDTIVGKASYNSGSNLQNKFGAQVEEYIFGGNVRSIANFAFYNQSPDSLRSISLPEGLEAIGNWAFGYIEHLTSISIPSTVQTIGTDAFAYCTNLRSVELGEGLMTINGQAFWMCDNLTSVTCNALTPPTLNQTAFDHNQNDTLFVPCEAKESYKQADYWKNFSNILCIDDTIGGNTEPDVPEQLTFTLNESWQFIMLPTVFGLTQEDIIVDGEIAWGVYDSQWRAEGRSGWKAFNPTSGFEGSQAYIVRARIGSATLTIHIPEQAREKAAATIPVNYHPASHPQNANWNFVGNPYPLPYNITAALDAAGIESPVTIWNGTGYDMFTPGIDQKTLNPFEAFFIQLPDGGSEVLPLSPEHIKDSCSSNGVADENGALPGYFTINTSKEKVQFSRGNLQYQASTATWQFAENQYDVIGEGNANISATYDGWIDLFGWGTGNEPTKTNTDKCTYSTFVDWGTNAISNGGNTADMWRTLSGNEWTYITGQRTNHDSLCGRATVNGIQGFILLPDDWVSPGVPFQGSKDNGYELNQFSLEDWRKMEAAGAVFLPACGGRTGTEMTSTAVQYWSTNAGSSCYAYDIITGGDTAYRLKTNQVERSGAYGVRLVK